MQWIAPSEKDPATDTLEKRHWDASGQFCLRKSDVRGPRCEPESVRYSALGIRHWHCLPAEGRFDYLLSYYKGPHDATDRFDFAVPIPPARAKRNNPYSLGSVSNRPCT